MSVFYIRGKQYSLTEIEKLTKESFALSNIQTMPPSLYKYFPNTTDSKNGRNYSQEALESNSVFVQAPSLFDNPYDCSVLIDEQEFANHRIAYYAQQCGVKVLPEWGFSETAHIFSRYLDQGIEDGKQLLELFPVRAESKDKFELSLENFALSLQIELYESQRSENDWERLFCRAIHQEYIELLRGTVQKFRVACFTETPYSMLMWSHYANNHQGFCIEYEIPLYAAPYIQIFHNLMPVIYSDKRISILDQCIRSLQPPGLTADILWDIYKYGLLMKSMDWKYQNEWRLISCNNLLSNGDGYNCNFFKIKKVYLGSRMSTHDRLKIIEACKRQQIPYVGVVVVPNKYELLNCTQLCENCSKFAYIEPSEILGKSKQTAGF